MESVVDQLVHLVFELITPILGTLLAAIFVKIFQKLHLDVNASQQAKLVYVAQQAILESEEWASQRLKANLPVQSLDKLERATASILTKIPNIDQAEAIDIVHAQLTSLGQGAAVTLGKLSAAAKD